MDKKPYHLVTWSDLVAQEPSGRPGAIWSPIRSPEHLVVNLVVVDAFSLSILMKKESSWVL